MCCSKARRGPTVGRRLKHRLDEDTVASEDRLRSMELIVCKIHGTNRSTNYLSRLASALVAMSAVTVCDIHQGSQDLIRHWVWVGAIWRASLLAFSGRGQRIQYRALLDLVTSTSRDTEVRGLLTSVRT
jgi:hypothetical protein